MAPVVTAPVVAVVAPPVVTAKKITVVSNAAAAIVIPGISCVVRYDVVYVYIIGRFNEISNSITLIVSH